MISKRQHIIDAADRVFYREGFADVGIDRLVDEAGVALGTLYRHFKTRSAVIVGTLQRRNEDFLQAIEQSGRDQEGSNCVLALFDALKAWSTERGGNGCFFLRAAADYPNIDEIRKGALSHKQRYLSLVESRLEQGGWSEDQAKRLAPVIFMLLEGAVAAAFTLGDHTAIATAKNAAALVLDNMKPEPR